MKTVTRDKGHYKTIKRWIQQEDVVPAANLATPKYIKQILTDIKREIDNNTIMVGHFSTPTYIIDKSPKQNINKEILVLNDMLDYIELIDVYRTFHPKTSDSYSFHINMERFPKQIIC